MPPVSRLLLDENRIVVDTDEAFEANFGCDRDDIVGRSLEEIFNPRDRLGVADYYTALTAYTGGVLDVLVGLRFDQQEYYSRLRMLRDGTGWAAFIDNLGVPGDVVHRLLNRLACWSAVVLHSTDGIAILDPRARIIEHNACLLELLQFRSAHGVILTEESITGKRFFSLVRGDAFKPVEHAFATEKARKKTYFGLHTYNNKVLQVNLAPIFSPSRAFIGCSLLIRDRTAEEELVKARDAAEAATQAKSQFLANMSHELRTPLNAVIGITEMLTEDADNLGHDDFIDPLQRIQRAGNHLLNLINEILDLSKIESGMLELSCKEFDVALLIQDAIGTSTPLADKNNNRIEFEYPQYLGNIYSDPIRIRQIILNLLSNACKFTENGRIKLEVTREDSDTHPWIILKVSDTGIGMLPEQVNRIFEQFMQADNTTTRKYGGTGLGLAITQRLCQMMQGTIDVDSKPGIGTTFSVRLPIGKPEFETTIPTERKPS